MLINAQFKSPWQHFILANKVINLYRRHCTLITKRPAQYLLHLMMRGPIQPDSRLYRWKYVSRRFKNFVVCPKFILLYKTLYKWQKMAKQYDYTVLLNTVDCVECRL